MQNRKRDTDVQNRLLDSVGEGEGGMFQENSTTTQLLCAFSNICLLNTDFVPAVVLGNLETSGSCNPH